MSANLRRGDYELVKDISTGTVGSHPGGDVMTLSMISWRDILFVKSFQKLHFARIDINPLYTIHNGLTIFLRKKGSS